MNDLQFLTARATLAAEYAIRSIFSPRRAYWRQHYQQTAADLRARRQANREARQALRAQGYPLTPGNIGKVADYLYSSKLPLDWTRFPGTLEGAPNHE